MVKKDKRIPPFRKIYPLTCLPKLSKKHTHTQDDLWGQFDVCSGVKERRKKGGEGIM